MSAGHLLVDRYVETYPADVARRVEQLPAERLAALLAELSPARCAALLPHLSTAAAARAMERMPAAVAAAVAGELPLAALAALVRLIDAATASTLLDALPPVRAAAARALIAHAPDTAGAVMDPEVLTLPIDASVQEARALIAAHPAHLYYYLYVVDADGRLAGVVDIAELLQASDGPLRALATRSVTWLAAAAPLSTVFVHPAWRDFDALPVVGDDRRFFGVLRHRRMRQLMAHEQAVPGGEGAVRTVVALGEIYWLGLCGLLQGIAATALEPGDGARR